MRGSKEKGGVGSSLMRGRHGVGGGWEFMGDGVEKTKKVVGRGATG